MNEIDLKELIGRGDRTALLLGEIMGRLVVAMTTNREQSHTTLIEDLDDLLEMMKNRISSIYYENK